MSRPLSWEKSVSRFLAGTPGTVLTELPIVSTSSHWRYPPGSTGTEDLSPKLRRRQSNKQVPCLKYERGWRGEKQEIKSRNQKDKRGSASLSNFVKLARIGLGSLFFTTTVMSLTWTTSKYPANPGSGSSNIFHLCMCIFDGSHALGPTWSRLMSKP